MIQYTKEILIYTSNTAFNLNSLPSNIKNNIDKIIRSNPITGASYQIWSPKAGIIQFSALVCGEIYMIESNTVNYEISPNLIIYNTNLCSGGLTPTPTPTQSVTPTPTITPTPSITVTPTVSPSFIPPEMRVDSLSNDLLVYNASNAVNISNNNSDILIYNLLNSSNISNMNIDALIYNNQNNMQISNFSFDILVN